ncbi:MAG: ankyrin repeat protein [Chlamydiales bacterium]
MSHFRIESAASAKKLLELNAPLDIPDAIGRTPLHHACGFGDEEIALSLIHAGAEVNVAGSIGQTPLHIACAIDSNSVIRKLIAKDADVNFSDSLGKTPLHFLMDNGNRDMTLLLLQAGADPLNETHFQLTPFEYSFDDSDESGAFHFFAGFDKMQVLIGVYDNNLLQYLSDTPKDLLNETMVKNKSFNPLLIPILGADPSLYRSLKASSSEADFQSYLDDLKTNFPAKLSEFCRDAEYSIDFDQMKATIEVEIAIPPAPPFIELDELTELFDKINFSDPKAPHYRNPKELTDDGYLTTPEDLRNSLVTFVRRIKTEEPFVGTPSMDKPAQLSQFYKNLKKTVLHIISQSRGMDEDRKISAILDLAEAGGNCGTRYTGQAHNTYHSMTGSIKIESLPEKVQTSLLNMKIGIVERLASRMDASRHQQISDNPEPIHAYNDYSKLLARTLKLPVPTEIDFEDPFAQRFNEDGDTAWTNLFLSRFGPHQVIQKFKDELSSLNLFERETFMDWFQDFVDDDFQKDRFDSVKNKASSFLEENKTDPKAWRKLCEILVKEDDLYLNPSSKEGDLNLELKKARSSEFMTNFVLDDKYSFTDDAIIYFLKKTNILK